jgi:pyruvate-formate lyase-activating enzyme
MRILCLGNNTEDTDIKAKKISVQSKQPFHGLLSELHSPLDQLAYSLPGYYHSSIYDMEFGKLVDLMGNFDLIILLDQPIEEWSHPDAFYKTLQAIAKTSTPVKFLDPSYQESFNFFSQLVKENKSFCIFPFIELLVNSGHTTVCCRSSTPIVSINELEDFQKDKKYTEIREKMIQGTMIPDHCSLCYDLEKLGITSARQQETVEWANRLKIKNISDLKKLTHPVYYEVRASNKCNLMCRMCNPLNSHLIEREYRNLEIIPRGGKLKQTHTSGFEIINFESVKKLYVAGGEPTVMHEFYHFLDQCVKEGKTDIEILVNTNGTNITPRLKNLLKNFQNFQFIFSIDGYDRLNTYIRWPSDWNKIVQNWKYLVDNGHKVMVNVSVSIYNVSNLHTLYNFIDQMFPGTLIHCSLVTDPKIMSPFLFPDSSVALSSLYSIRPMQCYQNDLLFASTIDGLISYFENNHRPADLSEFFLLNDKLDASRSVLLKDYVPTLDKYRNQYYN